MSKAKNYGGFIKELREKAGWSQEDISQKLGVSRPTYILIEKGERELTIHEAGTIARLFELSMGEFLSMQTSPNIIVTKPEAKTKKPEAEERISVPQEKLDKFKEVLLYVLKKVGAKPNVGEAVLCKLMYFIDFDYYEKFEEQLMGAVYIKNHFGPTPVAFVNIIKQMEEDKDLARVKSKYFNFEQKKYLPLRDPNLSLFTAKEIQTIDDVISRLSDKTAAEMKEYSHGDIPWVTAAEGKKIDYESVFYRTPAYSVRSYSDEV